MPKRIQLSRRKGFRLPSNAVNVARPSKWGNPFVIGGRCLGLHVQTREHAVEYFRMMLRDSDLRNRVGYPADVTGLQGKDLACWCKLGEPCHADVLLELANAAAGTGGDNQ